MLRWCGATVGKNVRMVSSAKIYGDFDLVVGNDVFISHEALIFGPKGSTITIEDHTVVGARSILVTGQHEYTLNSPCIAGKGTYADIRICTGACIDTRSIIVPGKTIGQMAHVAAGSVVTHDVPACCRVAGIPARVIKNFKETEK